MAKSSGKVTIEFDAKGQKTITQVNKIASSMDRVKNKTEQARKSAEKYGKQSKKSFSAGDSGFLGSGLGGAAMAGGIAGVGATMGLSALSRVIEQGFSQWGVYLSTLTRMNSEQQKRTKQMEEGTRDQGVPIDILRKISKSLDHNLPTGLSIKIAKTIYESAGGRLTVEKLSDIAQKISLMADSGKYTEAVLSPSTSKVLTYLNRLGATGDKMSAAVGYAKVSGGADPGKIEDFQNKYRLYQDTLGGQGTLESFVKILGTLKGMGLERKGEENVWLSDKDKINQLTGRYNKILFEDPKPEPVSLSDSSMLADKQLKKISNADFAAVAQFIATKLSEAEKIQPADFSNFLEQLKNSEFRDLRDALQELNGLLKVNNLPQWHPGRVLAKGMQTEKATVRDAPSLFFKEALQDKTPAERNEFLADYYSKVFKENPTAAESAKMFEYLSKANRANELLADMIEMRKQGSVLGVNLEYTAYHQQKRFQEAVDEMNENLKRMVDDVIEKNNQMPVRAGE